MIVLHESYQQLERSEAYAFSDKGQVCVALYARMVDDATVAVKLTRIISGTSAAVGYAYASAQATLSGSLTHAWNGGGSGMVYVGEHTVFEQSFAVTPGVTLSLSVIYDDTYITARTLSAACQTAGQVPSRPIVTDVIFDPLFPTRHADVTLYWACERGERYHVNICRVTDGGGEILYEADIYEKGVTFGLSGLPLEAGDELFFTVQAYNAAGAGETGYSDFYRINPTVWVYRNTAWIQGVPWAYRNGEWIPLLKVYVKDGEWK